MEWFLDQAFRIQEFNRLSESEMVDLHRLRD